MPDSAESPASEKRTLRRSKVFERVSEGIAALDSDLQYTYVNDQAEQILDTGREQLIGQHVWDAFPESKGTVAQEALEAAMETQEQQSFERYNSALDRWFEVRVYPDESGLSLCFFDITDRKTSEKELARTNRRLTALIENTSQAVYLKDCEGRYRFVNEAAAALFGLAPKEVVGKRDEELFDVGSATRIRRIDEQILEDEAADAHETTRFIDGDEHVFLSNKYPYYDEEGNVAGIMGIDREVTERKRRQRALERSRQRLKSLFKKLPDAVVVHDADGNVIDVNDQTIDDLGCARGELLSMNVTDFEVGVEPEELREIWAEMDVGDRDKGQGRHRRKDGSTFPVEVWVDKTRIGGEEQFIALSRNVTARIQREKELRRKNDRLDEFAGIVAHDLRSPLSVAQGRTAIAAAQLEGDGGASDDLQVAQKALDRMDDIISDTLVLARRGEAVESPEPVPVAEIVGRCWSMIQTGEASLVVVDKCTIEGDPDRLRHVFGNLFRNAIEHGGAAVTVRVGRRGDATLYVEDDGPGIPPGRREDVFEPGRTSREEGTGFGLAIVERIAEAHGWAVTLTEAEGGGARFEFGGVEVLS
ncbi:MAG: PAS domain S-box protein [Salinibacter sp.]|uniref:PAS domain S-box protein n=1 Tax=Salinibacter sp. TaxID=2065818 RepID=UPI0035D48B68